MKKIRFIRYGISDSLSLLCEGLAEKGYDVKKQKLVGSQWRGFATHFIINWGLSHRGTVRDGLPILNDPSGVAIASSKTKTFLKLKEVGLYPYLPKFTTEIEEAVELLNREGLPIYCRLYDSSSQGRGIHIASEVNDIRAAPLYTQKLPSIERELRVHVFNGNVIDFAQKKRMNPRRLEEEEISLDEDIRNLENGWIFARNGVEIGDLVKQVAVKAVSGVGLDFGAVDIVVSDGLPKILEINTAPGLAGTTLERYVEAISNLVG
jgi:hypothetical protein